MQPKIEPRIGRAVDTGMASFVASNSCSASLRERIQQERNQELLRDLEFHDLAAISILVASVSAFLAALAANVAAAYFQRKFLSRDEAGRVARDAAVVKINEVRLQLGPNATKKLEVPQADIEALAEHIRQACKAIEEKQ